MSVKLDNTNNNNKCEASLRLLMYTAMPARDDAWQAGYATAHENISIDDNPFLQGDLEHEYWDNGWWAGFYDEELLAGELLTELKNYNKQELETTKKY